MMQRARPKRELRRYRGLTIVGFIFLIAGLAIFFLPQTQAHFLAAGGAVFGAACAGIGIVQVIALRQGTKPHLKAMAWLSILFGIACLLLAIGAWSGDELDFSARRPRWVGIVFGSLGTLFFGGGGIYALLKKPLK